MKVEGWGSPRLAEITTLHDLQQVRAEWSALWDRCPAATPFQSPEWLLPWWRHRGRGKLRVLALRRNDRLVGLAPFFQKSVCGLPIRRLSLLGTGGSDYLDALIDPAHREPALTALAEYLSRDAEWDVCDFQQVPPGGLLRELASGACGYGLAATVLTGEVCPVLCLPPAPEELPEVLPRRLRKNVTYYRRRAEPAGAEVSTATAADLPKVLESLFALHGARWRARRQPGVFLLRGVRAFHREAAWALLRRGWLRLHALRIHGRVAAVLYCLVAGERAYYYAVGFDPACARLSPGTLLIAHAVEEAVRLGAREFDFLRGQEEYKYRWGARDREPNARLVFHRAAPAGRAGAAICHVEAAGGAALKRFAQSECAS